MSVVDNESVHLTFDNLLADHLAASRLYYKSTVFAKVDKIVAGLLLLVGTFGVGLVGVRWWTIVFFPLAIAEWFNLLSIRPLQIRAWFQRNPKFKETYYLTLDHDGIHFRTASMDSRIAWDHYSRVIEDERLCLLVYGSQMYTVIPKRFMGERELAKFRALVQQHVGNS